MKKRSGEGKKGRRKRELIREQGELEGERRTKEIKLLGLFCNGDEHKILQAAKSTHQSRTVWSYD